jgi:DNA (cytosine-5)-methyltransferase 1
MPEPRPLLLDAFCCQGGASAGYVAAGFKVVGVDINPQPRYPYEFHQADAVEFVREHGHKFAVRAGSPPCRRHTKAQRIRGNEHPDLIGPFREACEAVGGPYVIENVPGAPLLDPVMLCGSMFALGTYRHRLFESNVPLATRLHPRHVAPQVKMGRALQPGARYQAVGHFTGAEAVAADMGVPWMTRDGIRECIPPAYTQFLGEQLLAHLAVSA